MSRKGKIYWLSTEEGGRKNYPTIETYYATTYITQLSSYWSIIVHLLQPNKCISDCEVSFLVDKAPYEILNTIENLDIYEGPKKVATIYFSNELTDNKERYPLNGVPFQTIMNN